MTAIQNPRSGFTLVETLAALAIGSTVILSTGALLHQNLFFFDHGMRTVDRSEQLALAVESLTRDLGSVRFIVEKTAKGSQAAAFVASAGGEDAPAKMTFITSGGKAAGPQGEEAVSLSVETADGFSQIVRRRAAWGGPRFHLADMTPGDPVVLLKGKFDFAFFYSELTPDGQLIWRSNWTGEKGLPHSVRLTVRNRETDADLLPGAEFPVRADAPADCAGGEEGCLTLNAGNAATQPNSGR